MGEAESGEEGGVELNVPYAAERPDPWLRIEPEHRLALYLPRSLLSRILLLDPA
jgi:hypothetical protein